MRPDASIGSDFIDSLRQSLICVAPLSLLSFVCVDMYRYCRPVSSLYFARPMGSSCPKPPSAALTLCQRCAGSISWGCVSALGHSCIWTPVLRALSAAPMSAGVTISIDLNRHMPIDMCRHVSGCISMCTYSFICIDWCRYVPIGIDKCKCVPTGAIGVDKDQQIPNHMGLYRTGSIVFR